MQDYFEQVAVKNNAKCNHEEAGRNEHVTTIMVVNVCYIPGRRFDLLANNP